MTINPTYSFVLNVAEHFELPQQVFEEGKASNLEAWKDGLISTTLVGANLPHSVIAEIADHRIQNAAEWLHMTGLIKKTTKTMLPLESINKTARTLLERLKELELEKNPEAQLLWDFEHPYEELCKQIFLKAYGQATDAGKQEILGFANAVSPDDMKISIWDLRAYRIKRAVGNFFNHGIVKLSLAYVIFYISFRLTSSLASYVLTDVMSRFPLVLLTFVILITVSVIFSLYSLCANLIG